MTRAKQGRGAAISYRDLDALEGTIEQATKHLTPAARGRMARSLLGALPPVIYATGQAHRISQLDPRGALVHLLSARRAIDLAISLAISTARHR